MNAVAERTPRILTMPSWKTLGFGAAALTAALYVTSGDFKNPFSKTNADVQTVAAPAKISAATPAASSAAPVTNPVADPNWLRRNTLVQAGPAAAGATLPSASSPIQQSTADIRTPRTFTFLYNEVSIRDAQTDSRKGNTIRISHDKNGDAVLIAPMKWMRTFSDQEIYNLFDAATTAGVGGYIQVKDTDTWYADGQQDFVLPPSLWKQGRERDQIIVILKDAFQQVKGGESKLTVVHNTGTSGPRAGNVDGYTFDLKDPKFQSVRVETLDLVK